MAKINSRKKGAAGEREFAHELADRGFTARRGQQFAGGGDSPDVVTNVPGVHFEVKRVERFRLYAALDQATRDAKDGTIPVVAHRQNKKDWVVVLGLDDFLNLTYDASLYRI